MVHDIRYVLRVLVQSPAFALVAVVSLAPGIGAHTAIFSLLFALVLRPVFMTDQRNPRRLPLSHLNDKDLRDQNQVFSGMTAVAFAPMNRAHDNAAEQATDDW